MILYACWRLPYVVLKAKPGRCTGDYGTLTQQSHLLADFRGCMDWLLEPAQAEMGYPVTTPALEKACRRASIPPALLET